MTIIGLVLPFLSTHPLVLFGLAPLFLLTVHLVYSLSPLQPLHHVPGPPIARLTSLWLVYHAWVGDECTLLHALHARYGPLVRTGPRSVHIQPGTALHDVYSGSSATGTASTGFLKPAFYRNFDVDGHVSIFSAVDPGHRAVRAKAVVGIFSPAALRKGRGVVEGCVARFVERLRREKGRAVGRDGEARGRVDVLNVARGLAIDTVTSYLFGEVYGGCEEDLQGLMDGETGPKLSASDMVNAFVAVGRFWYLPTWAFSLLDGMINRLYPDHAANRSIANIDEFVTSVVSHAARRRPSEKSSGQSDHYQTRLLSASISPSETHAQCKDLIFAGTDSTAMNLATIMHRLSASPSTLEKLKAEIEASDDDVDPQSLPFLRATIREGLRLGMANPSRLPRVVPPSGWTFEGCFLPAGIVMGCSAYELHLNPGTFPEPNVFKPERWLETTGTQLELMNRDFIPFGMGPRQCIARNLATVELFWAVKEIAKCGVLEGSKPVRNRIEILEWFNSKVKGEKIEVQYA